MHSRITSITLFFAATAAFPSARTAHAADVPEPIRIHYAAPKTCEGAATFRDAVLRRTAKARIANPAENAREFDIAIHAVSAGWRGRLTIRDVSGPPSERHVEGTTCLEVVDALALIAVLAIDPQAINAPTQPDTAPAPLRLSQPETTPQPAPPPPSTATALPPRTVRPSPASDSWGGALGVQLSSTWGPAQGALWTLPAFLELSSGAARAGAPYARLSLARGRSDTIETEQGSGRFVWTVGRVDAGAMVWQSSWGLSLMPFAMFEAGALQGQGSQVDHPRVQTRSWVATGLGARLRWRIYGPLFAEGQGALAFPLVRDRFFLEPNATLHRAPWAVPSAAAGLGSCFL